MARRTRIDPFEIVVMTLILSNMVLMALGAYLNHAPLFESSKQVTITLISAYAGKRWGAPPNPPTS